MDNNTVYSDKLITFQKVLLSFKKNLSHRHQWWVSIQIVNIHRYLWMGLKYPKIEFTKWKCIQMYIFRIVFFEVFWILGVNSAMWPMLYRRTTYSFQLYVKYFKYKMPFASNVDTLQSFLLRSVEFANQMSNTDCRGGKRICHIHTQKVNY